MKDGVRFDPPAPVRAPKNSACLGCSGANHFQFRKHACSGADHFQVRKYA